MKDNCQDAIGHLYQYLDAEVDPTTAAVVKGHLDDCTGCFESFHFERRLKLLIRDCLTEDMPEELEQKVIALIREESR